MKTLLFATLLTLLLATTPPVAADPGPSCVDPEGAPDEVAPCVDTEICFATLHGCFDPLVPRTVVEWLRDQFGPCTCDPQPTPI